MKKLLSFVLLGILLCGEVVGAPPSNDEIKKANSGLGNDFWTLWNNGLEKRYRKAVNDLDSPPALSSSGNPEALDQFFAKYMNRENVQHYYPVKYSKKREILSDWVPGAPEHAFETDMRPDNILQKIRALMEMFRTKEEMNSRVSTPTSTGRFRQTRTCTINCGSFSPKRRSWNVLY